MAVTTGWGYTGGAGDVLDGGDGNDYLVGDAAADTFIGGAGSDTVSYYFADAGLTARLTNPALNTGEAAGDSYSGIENLYGSQFADTLCGDANANTLTGWSGNDDFVFKAGEANGNTICDFEGGGALALDELIFQGYGAGATFVQTSATAWQINYASGSETINFTNAAAIHATDYSFT